MSVDKLSAPLVSFYEIGEDIILSPEIKASRYDLSNETGMPLRDLRPITHLLNRQLQVAGLVTRPHAFLVNIQPLQSIIMHDRIRIFNLDSDEQPYVTALIRKLHRPSTAPFEHRALESILSIAVKKVEQQAASLGPRLTTILEQTTRNPTSQHLWDLRQISDAIEVNAAYVRTALTSISRILSKDEEMAMMYLTDRNNAVIPTSHREVELILEAAEDRLQALDHAFQLMQIQIRNAEQYLQISNDTQRNEIIRVTSYTTIAALACSSVAVVSSTFGMNLLSGLETNPSLFWYTVYGMSGLFMLVLGYGTMLLRRIDSDRPRSHRKFY